MVGRWKERLYLILKVLGKEKNILKKIIFSYLILLWKLTRKSNIIKIIKIFMYF